MNRLCLVVQVLMVVLFQRLTSEAAIQMTFHFREPQPESYIVELGPFGNLPTSVDSDWIHVHRALLPDQSLDLGRRLVLIPRDGTTAQDLVAGRPLNNLRAIHPGIWVVEAIDAWTAAEQAEALSQLAGVQACYPAQRFPWSTQDLYAPASRDPYFSQQWHLENRTPAGPRQGLDINVRAAWPYTRGGTVMVAVADDGVEMGHPDLVDRFRTGPHFNFGDQTTNAGPSLGTAAHSTAVSGLIAATGENQLGVTGVAPEAQLASWVIFRGTALAVDTVGMKQMFEAYSNVVHVQNHSWGAGGTALYPLPPLENLGISNAFNFGRQGRGVVMVRAASNYRANQGDANADGYASDPRVITVGAARSDGRAARYSNPGSCVLVSAPSGEVDAVTGAMDPLFPTLVTTDLTSISGVNQILTTNDSADYRFNISGFSGTSGATPIISGVVALILAANPALTVRDVQQILILSSQHLDLADPAIVTNSAGLRVSYNLGFGIPDAGTAVKRALAWHNRPALSRVTKAFSNLGPIPDDGLRVEVTGNAVPVALQSIPVSPALGPHPEDTTPFIPLSSVGSATAKLSMSLSNQVGLCVRGSSSFTDKIQNAASAGAQWLIIYNNQGTTERATMLNTEYVKIPAVFMGKDSGDALELLLATNNTVKARLRPIKTTLTVSITNTLICEHVGVRLRTDHTRRGDLRVTLVSPSGTRSILQRVNTESTAGPTDWTYYSVHHFFEPSAGPWKLDLMDEQPSNSGKVLGADLVLSGVPILDTDGDGLDDGWELTHFGSLTATGSGDPDQDGASNAVEQLLQTDPKVADIPFILDLSSWSPEVARISWPGTEADRYRILGAASAEGPYNELEIVPGRFPVTEWFTPLNDVGTKLLKVERLPR